LPMMGMNWKEYCLYSLHPSALYRMNKY
jgi:hypothetical protein